MAQKSIVFINQATGYLTIDIINNFIEEYEDVALIAGSVRVQNNDLHRKVKWSKIITYNRSSPFWKALSWLIGTVQVFFLLATRYRSYEVFYISIPPTAYLLSLLLPQRFSVLIYDIYPDALRVFKIGKRNPIYRFCPGLIAACSKKRTVSIRWGKAWRKYWAVYSARARYGYTQLDGYVLVSAGGEVQ